VASGATAWIVVQDAERKANFVRPGGELREDVGSADRTETSMLPRRGLVVAHQILTPHPANVGSLDATSCPKGSAMSFAAHAAMTEQHVSNRPVDFQGYALAQTACAKEHGGSADA